MNEEYEKESQSLSNFAGKTLVIKALEYKALGKRDGVVMTLSAPVADKTGAPWSKIHTSTNRIVKKLQQVTLGPGDSVTVTVISGTNENGTWYDIQ